MPTRPLVRDRLLLALTGLLTGLLLNACQPSSDEPIAPKATTADDVDAAVALKWTELHLKLVRHGVGFSPPVASRTFGYAGLALYEAVVPGLPERRSLVGQLQELTQLPQANARLTYNWAVSANAAQATVLRGLFANATAAQKASIDSLETALLAQYKTANVVETQRSAEFGRQVGDAIFAYSKTDGGHEGYSRNFPTTYVVPNVPGAWQPTENGRRNPMQPYWGNNRLFVAQNKTLPMPLPLPVSTDPKSQYYAQYLEVYSKNVSLTPDEKAIAVWWADDPSETWTPPGHSYNLARIAVRDAKTSLGKAAETFARVGISISDAFVLCWKCKYTYHNERPYTFVRRAIDPTWVPFWPAPPFPGFASGHATQSGAAATVLTDLYGAGFAFIDDSHVGRPRDAKRDVAFKARSFHSFWETAEESALSRFLGGIHTRQDNEVGLQEGRKIGRNVNRLAWKQ